MAPIRFTIFRFVIKRFGNYRGVRPLTQAFDVGLNILTMVTAPSVHHAIDQIRREIATTPAIGSITPLDEFATAATNLLPFLAHDITSQVESVLAQSKRLSCTSVSVAVGQIAVFLRLFEG